MTHDDKTRANRFLAIAEKLKVIGYEYADMGCQVNANHYYGRSLVEHNKALRLSTSTKVKLVVEVPKPCNGCPICMV
jgi:hypothetical protein